MSRNVKCKICGQVFDRDLETCMKISNRYAHLKCAEEANIKGEIINPPPQKDPDLTALEEYIKKIFNIEYVYPRIRKQINEYHNEYNYSYNGILKTLKYWFEIKNEPIESANGGIGIVPYVFNESYKYYYKLYMAQEGNKNKDIEDYKPKEKIITIQQPYSQPKKIKLFFEDEERRL